MNARSLEFFIPGDLRSPTGGYGYDRRIIAGLRELGWRVTVHELDADFPDPGPTALDHARTLLSRAPDNALVLIDGLAAGAMPQVLWMHASRLRIIALVHHPLADETGLQPERREALRESERLALQAARHVISTSERTQRTLIGYGVPLNRSSVVEPGTDPSPLATRARNSPLQLLCVATLTPRKGHDVLFSALAACASRNWHLVCAGSFERTPQTYDRLREQIARLGLQAHVRLVGEVDAVTLSGLYRDADLFVLPTRYEGYGMVVAEALAHGLPVISTRTGRVAELVGSHAGLLVEPEDVNELAAALQRVLEDARLLESLGHGAEAVRTTLPDWPYICQQFSRELELQDSADGH